MRLLSLLFAAVPFSAYAAEPVLLNDATAEQLAAIEGVGQADAVAIVELRSARGGQLGSVEELRVLPLAEETLASLRQHTALEVHIRPPPADLNLSSAQDVLARFSHEPTVNQVHGWAADYANLSPDRVAKWLTQSSAFAALPEVQLTYYVRDDFDQGFEYYDENGLDPRTPGEYSPVIQDADEGQTREYRVRLTFDLDKLIMSSERIRVINEAQDIVKLRDQVLAEVTRLYFERRRLQAERLLLPKQDPMSQVKEELRLMELTAGLDALTGGAFSAAVSRGGAGLPPAP